MRQNTYQEIDNDKHQLTKQTNQQFKSNQMSTKHTKQTKQEVSQSVISNKQRNHDLNKHKKKIATSNSKQICMQNCG